MLYHRGMKKIFSGSFIALVFLLCVSTPLYAHETTTETILITQDGFDPQELSIEQDTEVTFINNDTIEHWPASNPHPTHDVYPDFDPAKAIPPGKSWVFTFEKQGTWRYHDHLNPHLGGSIIVRNRHTESFFDDLFVWISDTVAKVVLVQQKKSDESNADINPSDFLVLKEKEQMRFLDLYIDKNGVGKAWQFVVNTFTKHPEYTRNAHEMAHLVGIRIYQKEGLKGIGICSAEFAFACYHGFTEQAFVESVSLLLLERACEKTGSINSGPWASCIHGIGHGVATHFNTTDLARALSFCKGIAQGSMYCFDGVFMEFATNAPPKVFQKVYADPLYPCDQLSKEYTAPCSRSQPRLLARFLNNTPAEIARICLHSSDKNIQYYCIDALGLDIGQQSGGNASQVISECRNMPTDDSYNQCVSAGAEEIVFQKLNGWKTASNQLCNLLSVQARSTCLDGIQDARRSYQ